MQNTDTTTAQAEDKIGAMFKAGTHFGYSRSSRHPKMKQFIFGLKNNVEVFDLEKTKQQIDEVADFVKNLGKEKKLILFVGTKTGIKDIVEKHAREIGMPCVTERWLGGTLTNFKKIRERVEHMQDLMQKTESGELKKYTKKEQLQIEKKIIRLKRYFSGLEELNKLPSLLIVVDTKEEKIVVDEAKKMNIPVLGILNSDCNPEDATYVIPANDNSRSSVEYLLGEITMSYKEGLKEYVEQD